MRILAIEKELSSLERAKMHSLLSAEAARVWALEKQDVIRDVWFTRPDHRAVLMLECATEAEAREQLESLPLVRNNCIEFEVLPLQPYDGFERLFAGVSRAPAEPAPPTA
jgi:hypothetical protein